MYLPCRRIKSSSCRTRSCRKKVHIIIKPSSATSDSDGLWAGSELSQMCASWECALLTTLLVATVSQGSCFVASHCKTAVASSGIHSSGVISTLLTLSVSCNYVCIGRASRMLTEFSTIKCSGKSIDRFEVEIPVLPPVKSISRRAATIGLASTAFFTRLAPTKVVAEDLPNATVSGSDQVDTMYIYVKMLVHMYRKHLSFFCFRLWVRKARRSRFSELPLLLPM